MTETFTKIPIFRPEVVDTGLPQELRINIPQLLEQGSFIRGQTVSNFENQLAHYLSTDNVISVGNGTDALLAALMALGLNKGDEVITPAFGYPAAVEMICLLGLTPVLVDVDWNTFNLDPSQLEEAISPKTKVILPLHLFGLPARMNDIMRIAEKYQLTVIEDAAQSLGSDCVVDGKKKKSGTIASLGCTSFFPSKNLGAWGDGGAIFVNRDDPKLLKRLRSIVSHGQEKKYLHTVLGMNSRLDTIQAEVLCFYLSKFEDNCRRRIQLASRYRESFAQIEGLELPLCAKTKNYVPNLFTVKVANAQRDALQSYLGERGIASQVYYPLPIHRQKAYAPYVRTPVRLTNSEQLPLCVLSLPCFPSMKEWEQEAVISAVKQFFRESHV
mgnify:FL=1